MKEQLKQLIQETKLAAQEKGAYVYLTEITAILTQMLASYSTGEVKDELFRKKIVGGVGRIVTEDLSFSQTALGTRVLEMAEHYLKEKSHA